jgi:protein-L-isoaspartate(D-aspartate) O-methyltransferase
MLAASALVASWQMARTDADGNGRMVDHLRRRGRIRSAAVEAAFRAVDRRAFVPTAEARAAYDDAPIRLRHDDRTGAMVSTISQPSMVAYMLEELDVHAGHHVLEIATASGYDAALLSRLVGDGGTVHTVEIDAELAATAAARLRDRSNVTVVHHDGHEGFEPAAPYDRIIVTAGALEVEDAWRRQLVDGGRLVVPVTAVDGRGLCLTLDEVDGRLVRRASLACGFVRMRRSTAPDADPDR